MILNKLYYYTMISDIVVRLWFSVEFTMLMINLFNYSSLGEVRVSKLDMKSFPPNEGLINDETSNIKIIKG